MSLADVSVDSGATLSQYPPDISGYVGASSFDPSINYIQAPVTGLYDPTGLPIDFQAVDATQATLTNQLSMPTSTEDAVAYSATNTAAPPGTGPYPIYNASPVTAGHVVDASSSGGINAPLHGILDAITSTVRTGMTVDYLANNKQLATPQQQQIGPIGPMRPVIGSRLNTASGPIAGNAVSGPLLIAGLLVLVGLGLAHG